MNCQEAIDLMEEALDGRIPPALVHGFEEHVATCGSCGTYLGHLRLTREALGKLRAKGSTSPRRQELLARFRRQFEKEPDGN